MTFGLIETIQSDDGGDDTITTLAGFDIVLGGNANDTIDVGQGNNIIFGDDGFIDYVRAEREPLADGADLNSGDIDLIQSTSTTAHGGADSITSGDGNDIIIGGRHCDNIEARNGDNLVIGESGSSLVAASPAESQITTDLLTWDELSPLFDEAVIRWSESGLIDGHALALLDDTSIQIVDFFETTLGMAADNTILIDSDAAGYGWFIDQTPGEDEEFGLQISDYELGH